MERRDHPSVRVWILAETDYRFGAGDLHMTVESVDWASPQFHEGEAWYLVRGVELTADGRVVGPRQTMIKSSRLRSVR